MQPKLFLIDGAALAFRSHFAFSHAPLRTSGQDSMETSALFGFTSTLLRLMEREKPTHLAVVFDSREPTFRHLLFKDYKATRDKMPDELAKQLPFIQEFVETLQIPFIAMPSFEADDIIGTFIKLAVAQKLETYVVTGDKDFLQLIVPGVFLYNTKQGNVELSDASTSVTKFGVKPEQIIDLFALMGDSSDNVPGVPGVGEKTAQKLMAEFGSLDQLYDRIAEVKPDKLRAKLVEHKEQAYLCKKLVTIHTDVPVLHSLDDLAVKSFTSNAACDFLRRFEFTSLIKIADQLANASNVKVDTKEAASRSDHHYKTIATLKDFQALIHELENQKTIAFDTETTSLDPYEARLLSLSFSYDADSAYCVLFGENRIDLEAAKPLLHRLFSNSRIAFGGQNAKFDTKILQTNQITVPRIAFDTMIESYLLAPEKRSHSLDTLTETHLRRSKIPTEALIGKGKQQITMDLVPIEQLSQYTCEDSDFTLQIHRLLEAEILATKLDHVYQSVELPLIPVLGRMELTGIRIDESLFAKLSLDLGSRLAELEKEIREHAGTDFNPSSPKQLAEVLYTTLKVHEALGIRKLKKTTHGFSTDQETLEQMQEHPLVKSILEYRSLSKLKSTYIDVLPTLIQKKTGRIHTSFNQTVAATGRLSSSDPNLQNIPIRSDLGKTIRKGFIPEEGWKLISADYSQIELRLLAHLSADENLIQFFKRGEDIHTQTASKIFDIPVDQIDTDKRSQAKAINFGVLYGMGATRLARETGLTNKEAKNFIEKYFSSFPTIKQYLEGQIAFARENGYVETIIGRKRPLPDITSSNMMLRANAERIATNTPIQGSAADLIKLAMINIDHALTTNKMQTRLLLQVHDELVLESPPDEINAAKELIVKHMISAMKLNVPLHVSCQEGDNWAECHG